MTHALWPLFDLRLRTERLELRPPSDEDIMELADLAARGVHDPGAMPFDTPWTRGEPAEVARNVVNWQWSIRSNWQTDNWTLAFVVLCDGVIVGTQDLAAKQFATLRVVETGSWLGVENQGRGIGKEMRHAVLAFAFDHLAAAEARTFLHEGNSASLGVTTALEYEANGYDVKVIEGSIVKSLRFVLTQARWSQRKNRIDVSLEGADPVLPMLI